MMNNKLKSFFILLTGLIVTACSDSTDSSNRSLNLMHEQQHMMSSRWYNEQQVKNGAVTFQQYCAECHKADASGSPDWRQKDASGKYPPPPLNGTAHAWHHSLDVLRRTVYTGGVPLGGSMPAFGDKLTAQEIDEVLAWVQSNWSDEIYSAWQSRNQ